MENTFLCLKEKKKQIPLFLSDFRRFCGGAISYKVLELSDEDVSR